MTGLASFLMDFPSTGRMLSWLHFLPLLSGFCSVGYLLVIAAMRSWNKNPESKAINWWITKFASRLSKRREEGRTSWAPVWFAVFCVAGLLYGATRIPEPNIVTEHNVKVLAQLNDAEWRMSSDEEPDFVYRTCSDFPAARVIWVGYVADYAKWEERGACKSIQRQDLGFWWRVGHDQYRRVE